MGREPASICKVVRASCLGELSLRATTRSVDEGNETIIYFFCSCPCCLSLLACTVDPKPKPQAKNSDQKQSPSFAPGLFQHSPVGILRFAHNLAHADPLFYHFSQ